MNGLAVCAGVGGLELGIGLAVPSYRTITYVEGEAYAVAVLITRMEEGYLDTAPIWDDIGTFDGRPWRGKVDIISAGFPCQPWSTAGKQKGTEDERWIWPDIDRVIGEVRPPLVFLENVPGLLRGGLGHVLGSLAELGYDAEWDIFSAQEIGAPHLRRRVFILAHTPHNGNTPVGDAEGLREGQLSEKCTRSKIFNINRSGKGEMADTTSFSERESGRTVIQSRDKDTCGGNNTMGDTDNKGLEGRNESVRGGPDQLPTWPPSPEVRGRWANILERWPKLAPATESPICGMVNGPSPHVDRLRAIGNAVVPAVAAEAFTELYWRLNAEKG